MRDKYQREFIRAEMRLKLRWSVSQRRQARKKLAQSVKGWDPEISH